VGLYLVPILLLSVSLIFQKNNLLAVYYLLFTIYLISTVAIILTRSQGAFIALGAGLVVFVFLAGYKKLATLALVVGIIGILITPQLRQAATFQDQAGQNRLILWGYTTNYLTESPANFVLGPGFQQFFRKIQKPHYQEKKLERLIYAHNIFLNFWTETGLLGMLAIIGIIGYCLRLTLLQLKQNQVLAASLVAALTAIIVHGLVDVPFFKNDLAFVFWIIMSISLHTKYQIPNNR
jgi:O-antigen ligase